MVRSTSYSSTPAADSVQAKIPATHPDQFYHHHCRVGWLTTTHPDQFYHHHCRVGWITATHPDQFYHQHCRVGWITATHPDKFYHQHCRVRWITVFRRLPLTNKKLCPSCANHYIYITFTVLMTQNKLKIVFYPQNWLKCKNVIGEVVCEKQDISNPHPWHF